MEPFNSDFHSTQAFCSKTKFRKIMKFQPPSTVLPAGTTVLLYAVLTGIPHPRCYDRAENSKGAEKMRNICIIFKFNFDPAVVVYSIIL